jgi:energy-coupling factor transporter ATP-binding protein EcfA2
LPDYEPAFGLRDNPFSPRSFGQVDAAHLSGIEYEALPLAKAPGLVPLFVAGAGPFKESLDQFEMFLELGGYHDPEAGDNLQSKTFRVIGPQGSGKSTLANMLIHRLKECGHKNLKPIEASALESQLERAVDEVEKEAGASLEGVCCVVFDDVRLDGELPLHQLHRRLRNQTGRPVVMFEILHHAQDLLVPPPSLQERIDLEDMRTDWLSAAHAVEFVSSRIRAFRTDCPELTGDLEIFPFDPVEIADLIGDGDGSDPAPFTLRSLSRVLSKGLGRELIERKGDEPIAGLSAEELTQRRISVKALYDRQVEMGIGVKV